VFFQVGNYLIGGCNLVVEGNVDSVLLRYFMFADSRRHLEDRTYPLTETSGRAAGNYQLHDSFRRVAIRHEKPGQQQQADEVDTR
jgi:hypothetical protein